MNTVAIAVAVALVNQGVDYTSKDKAPCPLCGSRKVKVTNTLPWEGDIRIRYHQCRVCRHKFKSIETNH